MSADAASGSKLKLTRTQWLICFIATIGFLFDIYELLMLPLIGKDALMDLVPGLKPGTPEFTKWFRLLFFIPAICGGIFGLLGGWLTDRFGRRRVLTFSILLYAFAAFFTGFCTTPEQLLFFRCLVFIGVCVEFVAAVAWLTELFPDPVQREKVLGYTLAFSSVGGLSVAVVNGFLAQMALAGDLPNIPGWFSGFFGQVDVESSRAVWRYTLMSGLIPAIPLIVIRPFLPESPAWQRKKDAGELQRASLSALFTPELKRATIVTTILFALAYGAAFGAVQQMRVILPKNPEVIAASTEAKEAATEKAKKAGKPENEAAGAGRGAGKAKEQLFAAKITKVQEVGGLYGRVMMTLIILMVIARGSTTLWTFIGWSSLVVFLIFESFIGFGFKVANPAGGSVIVEHLLCVGKGALIGGLVGVPVWWLVTSLSKRLKGAPCRSVLRVFLFPGILLMPIIFGILITNSLSTAYVGMFIAGFVVVGQFTFLGQLLPRFFPLHLRGTGESFAANVGGRLIGTSFAFVVFTITDQSWQGIFPTALHGPEQFPIRMAYTTAIIGFLVFTASWIASGYLPDPQYGKDDEYDAGDEEDKKETVVLDDVVDDRDEPTNDAGGNENNASDESKSEEY